MSSPKDSRIVLPPSLAYGKEGLPVDASEVSSGSRPFAPVETVARLLHDRHSVRAFLPGPIPKTLIERMLLLGQQTATWCNVQPWQVLVTSGDATERLRTVLYEADASQADESDLERPLEYRGVYLDRRRQAGFALHQAVGIQRGDRVARAAQARENFRLFGAPHAAIVTTDSALGPYGVLDVGGYLATIALAAEALGIGLVLQAALAMRSPVVRRFFDLPHDRTIVAGFSFGWEDRNHPINQYRVSRADIAEAVTWVD